MSPIVKKQLFHGLRVFGIALWVIVALVASSVCWKPGMTPGENIFGVLNFLIHGACIYLAIKYDLKKEKEEDEANK